MSTVVIGAGLAGLSAAITLQNAGHEVLVLEASDRAGGRVASDVVDGFILDRGFQLINANYPELKRLAILDEIEFIEAPRSVAITIEGKRTFLGDPREHLFSALDGSTGSLVEKLGLISYLTKSPKSGVSVASQLQKLGKVYDRVLRPFLTGVFLCDPSEVEASVGKELIQSFVTGRPGLPANGAGVLASAMARKIQNIKFDTRVELIKDGQVKTNNGKFKFENLIMATDASTAAQLLELPEAPTQVGCVTWYHLPNNAPSSDPYLLLDGLQSGPVVNSIVLSNMVENYAPAGKSLVSTTTIQRASESEVKRHLSVMWGAPTQDWQLLAKYEIPAALPLARVGHRLANNVRISKNIFVAGDWRESPSQNGALKSGRRAAETLISQRI
ncbi:MAG: NAD(P)/FAD-dependent oxidoreductase [Candidatus Nanopelagicaceae bacterium]